MSKHRVAPRTQAIHGDHDPSVADVAPPIHLSSTYRAADSAEFAQIAAADRPSRFYTRYGNPTVARAERLLAGLEDCQSALLFASGMGAVSTTVLALLSSGDHVVAQRDHYMGTLRLLTELLPRFGIAHTLVDQTDAAAFAAAIRPETRLVIVETPSNPMLRLTDLAAVAGLARARGIVTLADNTFASPLNQRPAECGIDLVVHSATKYLGGHSDLLAGVLCGPAELVDRVWSQSIVLGACSNGFDAYLLLRGLRTLPLRVERQSETALALARHLEGRAGITRVHYPGLSSHPQHELAERQMTAFGGVLSFELEAGAGGARSFVDALDLVANAVSLGGVETLASHVGSMWHAADGQGAMPAGLIRLAVGLEHPDDIVRDIERGLAAAAKA
ncbi:MAG: aminotransferase class I/II-fold pyridoxal phosphate-dependent enzyme [Rhodocyclaceae bacterium]|nr:aminotransferase class I/II-fold pyridoxal phosphate-dependent enzyme [Rhodocyclaceae bacterium]